MVKHISDRVAVMYFGKIVETGPTEQVFLQPKASYTKQLLAAIPVTHPRNRKKRRLQRNQVA